MASRVSRRTVLRGILRGTAVGVALPPLEAMLDTNGTAFAQGGAIPTRYGVWWWGNGMRRDFWIPTNEGAGFDLKEETAPFQKVKESMTLLSGFNLPSNENVHNSGYAWLTAGHSDHTKPYHLPGALAYSSDQMVADAWAGQTKFPSLVLGVSRMGYEGNGTSGDISWSKNATVINAEFNPQAAFDRLFMDVTPGSTTPGGVVDTRERDARLSVLDGVLESAAALNARLGTNDRRRLDQHLNGIRELEQRLKGIQQAQKPTVACPQPARPSATGTVKGKQNSPEPLAATNEAMAEIIRLAFACDLTRVFSLQYIKSQGSTIFTDLTNRQFHAITHDGPQTLVHDINVYIMKHFAVLLEKLKNTPVGAENLLHYCCIVGTSEVSEGYGHQGSNMPMLLFGNAGGRLRGDMHIKGNGAITSRAILTAIRAVGVNASGWGANEGRATEPFPGIIV